MSEWLRLGETRVHVEHVATAEIGGAPAWWDDRGAAFEARQITAEWVRVDEADWQLRFVMISGVALRVDGSLGLQSHHVSWSDPMQMPAWVQEWMTNFGPRAG